MTRKRILIVDDHALFRDGLKALLARHEQYDVVGEASTGREGLRCADLLKPDLVLMDISLPDVSGIEITQQIRQRHPDVRVAIISMHAKIDYITEAFRAGATGYVVKESASERLVACLNALVRGEYFIDASVSHQVVDSLMQFNHKQQQVTDKRYGSLTPREQQILRLLAEAVAVRDIAEQLCISPKTVENHRANIMSKLDLHSSMELVRYAARLGLIDLELWKS